MKTAVEPVAISPAEPDLIDRIAASLPEEIRAEYYRELLHCRSLPENDEMLRLLRAMQFLVLLIEQAPSRIADERGKLDKLLTTALDTIRKMNAASDAWHKDLQRRLAGLPAEVSGGISPGAIAAKINENLQQIFVQSTIPQTAEALAEISARMKGICSDFSMTSDSIGHEYKGAAEDARKAVASIKSEVDEATKAATRFTREIAEKCSNAYRLALFLIAGGSLILGLALGMMLERWLLAPQERAVTPPAPVVQTLPQPAPKTPEPKASKN